MDRDAMKVGCGRLGANNEGRSSAARQRAGLIAVLAVMTALLVGPAVAEASWTSQTSGTNYWLHSVSCPSTSTCFTVGHSGTVLKTTNGSDWTGQTSGTGDNLWSVSCPSTSTCYAVGALGTIRKTTNDGSDWTGQTSGTGWWLGGVSCPSTSTCYAVGDNGTIRGTTNGGSNWTGQTSGTTNWLWGISCPSTSTCYAVGESGTILRTINGGSTWTSQESGTTSSLWGISCPSTSTCYAVGESGTILRTINGGSTWTSQESGTTNLLDDVSCPSVLTCTAVGTYGTIRATTDGGSTWTGESSGTTQHLTGVSCPSVLTCFAVGDSGTILHGEEVDPDDLFPPVPPGASDDCIAPATTVIDGYFGSLYARMRVKDAGSETWICARLQPEGGTELAGGKFVVQDADSTVTSDSNYGACSTEPGNVVPTEHPIRSGHIGDEDDPPFVPFLLDAWANDDGAAWACLQAGLGARVMFNGVGSLFERDDPTLTASPTRTPWTLGKASTDCETQVGGTKTQLVNAVISGTQVWLDAWQSGAKIQLCVRAEGSSTAGGRLTLDATGSPGVTPVLTQGTDTDACTTDVFVSDQDELYVQRSPTSANPASICVTKGTTSQRFTVGYTSEPDAPDVTWAVDS